MLSAYTDENYYETLRTHIDLLRVDDDIIIPSSSASTEADGQFIQLDTADGNQQQITALVNTDLNGDSMIGTLQAIIAGTEDGTGTTISFPAVQIFDNPEGITTGQVRTALSGDFNTITTNINAARDAINLHTTGNISTIEGDLETIANMTLPGIER